MIICTKASVSNLQAIALPEPLTTVDAVGVDRLALAAEDLAALEGGVGESPTKHAFWEVLRSIRIGIPL